MNKYNLNDKKAACLAQGTGNFGFWYHLANDYLRIGCASDAIDCYHKALEFDPLIFDTYSNIGDAYIKLGNVPKAITYFQKSVDVQPQYGNGWYSLGRSYALLSDKAQSLDCFDKSIHCLLLPPDESFYIIGYNFLKEKQLEKAYTAFSLGQYSLLAKRKQDYKAKISLNIAHIHFLQGEMGLAKQEYYNSYKDFGDFNLFIQNIEIDSPNLVKIGLDFTKLDNLIKEIKNPSKMYLKIFENKFFNNIKNKFKNSELHPGAIY